VQLFLETGESMKVRQGFVSNSSSSSYVCIVCGEEACGMDVDLSSYEMVVSGITGCAYCESHMSDELIGKSIRSMITGYLEDDKNENLDYQLSAFIDNSEESIEEVTKDVVEMDDNELGARYKDSFVSTFRYEIPEEACIVCNLLQLDDSDVLKYLILESNTNKESLLSEIRNKFENYNEFYKHINQK